MADYEDRLLAMMQAAINTADGTEPGTHDAFIRALLASDDIFLVWNLFERVHKPVLHRLYDMAKYKLEHPEPEPPPPARLEPPAPRRPDLIEPDDDEPEPGAALDPEMFKPLPGTVPQPSDPTPTSPSRHPAPGSAAQPPAPRVGSQRGVASLRGALDAISDISPWRWATNNEGIYLRDLDPEGILRWGEQGPAQRLFATWVYERCPRSSPDRAFRVSTFVNEGQALDLWRQALERVNIDARA